MRIYDNRVFYTGGRQNKKDYVFSLLILFKHKRVKKDIDSVSITYIIMLITNALEYHILY
jgi:hypothetical protein